MRALVAMVLVGCQHPSDPVVDDGPTSIPPDATDLLSCSAPNGSANVVVQYSPSDPRSHTTKVYSRLIAGVYQRPYMMSFKLELLFTDSSPLTTAAAGCCLVQGPPPPEGGQGCCSVPSLPVTVDVLEDNGTPGIHQAIVGSRGWDQGTLRITDYTSPFAAPPGRIAGTLSGHNNDLYVDATFDVSFCEGMLVTH